MFKLTKFLPNTIDGIFTFKPNYLSTVFKNRCFKCVNLIAFFSHLIINKKKLNNILVAFYTEKKTRAKRLMKKFTQ